MTDKVAIVTGGGSGLGEAIAKALATKGVKVVLSDINLKGAERVAREIEAAGGTASTVQQDVARPEDSEKVVNHALNAYGALHYAVNNAGIGGAQAPAGETDLADWARVININLNGVLYGMRYQIPAMLRTGARECAIVNMASILGSVGFANSVAYVSAKHGVLGLTKNAALEHAADGIRVNAVGPGFIRTPLVESSMDAEALAFLEGLHALGRLGTSEEVAELVAWLASDAASFVTGSYYPVDGGYLAR